MVHCTCMSPCSEVAASAPRCVARHEALRTRFELINGEPVQVIADASVGFSLQRHGLRRVGDVETAVREIADEEAFAPFDNPKIAVAVLLENSGFGGVKAAPIAGDQAAGGWSMRTMFPDGSRTAQSRVPHG